MQKLPSFPELKSKARQWFSSKQKKYQVAAILDAVLIFIILFNAFNPANKIVLPLVSPLQDLASLPQVVMPQENFAFAPSGSSRIADMDLNGLNTLAYFDIPILKDGSLNTDSVGYQSLNDSDTTDLFQKAKSNNTQVLLTLTQVIPEYTASFLTDPTAQDQTISQTIDLVKSQGVDGVVLDFEVPQNLSSHRDQFTGFVSKLSGELHAQVPGSEVALTLDNSEIKNPFYNVKALSNSADKVFMVASNFAVPEDGGVPVYGYNPKDYWTKVSAVIQSFVRGVPSDKLALERAWYGNGHDYPLYTPSPKPVGQINLADSTLVIDNSLIDRLVAQVPQSAQVAARNNLPYIINALKQENILNSNVLSYAMATIEHETDSTFQPISEIQGKMSARRLGYEGGEDYFGRGFIQLTHLRNYKIMGERIGMGDSLAENPDLASDPDVAAKILAAFFKDNNVANLASSGDFIDARSPINPDRNGYRIALLAYKYEDEF